MWLTETINNVTPVAVSNHCLGPGIPVFTGYNAPVIPGPGCAGAACAVTAADSLSLRPGGNSDAVIYCPPPAISVPQALKFWVNSLLSLLLAGNLCVPFAFAQKSMTANGQNVC